MDRIRIVDLEAHFRVGVSEQERAQPQRLLLTIEMEADLAGAAATDRLDQTIDYERVARRVLQFGEGRSWKLIEKLAGDLTEMLLAVFRPVAVSVEVKKFVIPQASHVSVRLSRCRPQSAPQPG